MVAKEVSVATTIDQQSGQMQVTTTSRVAEVRAELQASVEHIVEERMRGVNDRIHQLTNALEVAQQSSLNFQRETSEEVTNIKQSQQAVELKIQSVEQSVSQSSVEILTQMQKMMATMQNSMQTSFQSAITDLRKDIEVNMDPNERSRSRGRNPES